MEALEKVSDDAIIYLDNGVDCITFYNVDFVEDEDMALEISTQTDDESVPVGSIVLYSDDCWSPD
jgi:hypothetical protein